MNQISLAEYRQQIEAAIDDRRYQEAVAHCRHILEHYPKHVGAYWLMGKAMLETGQPDDAADMFQRVLSADPEHMLAWVGMSEVARQQDDLEGAVWYMARAFELATDNEMVAAELRHLYGELEGTQPEQLQLTEGALAKLYLKGDLLTRAVTELRQLIEEYPDRLDLKVALIEALWRKGQRVQAAELCQEILDEQPFNLKANLILGEIWSSSGREKEAEPYLMQAEALDPENEMAQQLFGSVSPLPPKEPQIAPLAYEREMGEEEIDWVAELETEESVPTEGEQLAAEIEIPDWLEELRREPASARRAEPEREETTESAAMETPEGGKPEEEVVEPAGEGEPAPLKMYDEEGLDWLRELATEGLASETEEEEEEEPEEMPAWLSELGGMDEEEMDLDELRAPAGGRGEAEIPDWLRDLVPPETVTEMEEERIPAEPPATEEREAEAEKPKEALEELEEMAGPPPWFKAEELPPAEEALTWLAQLTEGEVETLTPEPEEPAISAAETGEEAGEPAEPPTWPEMREEAPEPPLVEEPEPVPGKDEGVILSEEAPPEEEEEEAITAFPEVAPEAEQVSGQPEEAAAPVPEEAAPEPLTMEAEDIQPEPEDEVLPSEGAVSAIEPQVAAPQAEEPEEEAGPAPDEEALVEETMPAVPPEAPSADDLGQFIATQQAHVNEHPDDHQAQLELGRVLWQADKGNDAVEAYEALIEEDHLLDEVIADLEDYTEQRPEPRLMQALGDAYMKADRLQEALQTYRHALEKL